MQQLTLMQVRPRGPPGRHAPLSPKIENELKLEAHHVAVDVDADEPLGVGRHRHHHAVALDRELACQVGARTVHQVGRAQPRVPNLVACGANASGGGGGMQAPGPRRAYAAVRGLLWLSHGARQGVSEVGRSGSTATHRAATGTSRGDGSCAHNKKEERKARGVRRRTPVLFAVKLCSPAHRESCPARQEVRNAQGLCQLACVRRARLGRAGPVDPNPMARCPRSPGVVELQRDVGVGACDPPPRSHAATRRASHVGSG